MVVSTSMGRVMNGSTRQAEISLGMSGPREFISWYECLVGSRG